jgi:phage baseplate assembly protein W
MNPTFGSKIWDLLYEPYDASTKNLIMEDIGRIIASEPRVAAENVTVIEYEHGIQIMVDLIYIKDNLRDKMLLDFKRNMDA